jgi:hypothetical protein
LTPKKITIEQPRKEQTKPLIFEYAHSRVTRQISMSAKTADAPGRYVAWAAAAADADEQNAMTLTMTKCSVSSFSATRSSKSLSTKKPTKVARV